jgi:cytochrome d ubiquinol oxidase subunit II
MLALHGATWLSLRADGAVGERARSAIPVATAAFAICFVLAGLWLTRIDGYQVTSSLAHDGASNPSLKSVAHGASTWFANYRSEPLLWLAPLLAVAGAASAWRMRSRRLLAFLSSGVVCAAVLATAGLALFPFLLPSSSSPNDSLTVWDSSSSKLTLAIMLGAVVIFLPVVIAYTAFVYRVMRGPVNPDDVARDHSAY